ncbi:MAG: hypothetical protein HFI06_12915 [Eubacterium sp.]|jgi:hypothetical protein|nr:hypothetical protein [Eubacterium sp.]
MKKNNVFYDNYDIEFFIIAGEAAWAGFVFCNDIIGLVKELRNEDENA